MQRWEGWIRLRKNGRWNIKDREWEKQKSGIFLFSPFYKGEQSAKDKKHTRERPPVLFVSTITSVPCSFLFPPNFFFFPESSIVKPCLLYTSDAADEHRDV